MCVFNRYRFINYATMLSFFRSCSFRCSFNSLRQNNNKVILRSAVQRVGDGLASGAGLGATGGAGLASGAGLG